MISDTFWSEVVACHQDNPLSIGDSYRLKMLLAAPKRPSPSLWTSQDADLYRLRNEHGEVIGMVLATDGKHLAYTGDGGYIGEYERLAVAQKAVEER